jgi:hypothetical protein
MAAAAIPVAIVVGEALIEGVLLCATAVGVAVGVAVRAAAVVKKLVEAVQGDDDGNDDTDDDDDMDSQCCCGARGPSGKSKVHFIPKRSRKEAEEAARHYANADGVEHHASNTTDNSPHFHPTKGGVKIPGVHFQHPR